MIKTNIPHRGSPYGYHHRDSDFMSFACVIVSIHRQIGCLFSSLSRMTTQDTQKPYIAGHLWGESTTQVAIIPTHLSKMFVQNCANCNIKKNRRQDLCLLLDESVFASTGIDAGAPNEGLGRVIHDSKVVRCLKMLDTSFINTICHSYLSMINWIMPKLHVIIPMDSDGP